MPPDRGVGTGLVIRAFDPEQAKRTRTITFVASTSDRDRYGTVINQDTWVLDAYNSNPIIGYQHNVYGGWWSGSDPDMVIGKGRAYLGKHEGKTALLVDITFEPTEINPTAEKIFQKYLWGSLNAVSVGFREVGEGRETWDEFSQHWTYYYGPCELLEISCVNVPGNAKATARAMEASGRAAPQRGQQTPANNPQLAPAVTPQQTNRTQTQGPLSTLVRALTDFTSEHQKRSKK